MKSLCSYYNPFVLILFLLAMPLLMAGQEKAPTITSPPISCGMEVIDYLKSNYYASVENSYTLPNKKEHSFEEMLKACKSLANEAQSVICEVEDLKVMPKPVILHLNYDHYILLTEYENGSFSIFDPAAKHLKSVSQSYFAQNFSGNAIVLRNNMVSVNDLNFNNEQNVNGAFQHEYPPPNEDDDGDDNGDNDDDEPQNECRNNSGGSPKFSFNPISLNLVVVDVPMWYNAGLGPDIALKLVYNSNDHQLYTGAASAPTEYFPFGQRWSFAYATFYHVVSPDNIMLILPDGARQTFAFNGNSSTPAHADFHDKFDRYDIGGGYGYSLTIKETKVIYRFDNPEHGKLTSIEDRNGNTVTINYDGDFNLSSLTDAVGREVTFELNASARVTMATDVLGRTAIFEYGYTNDEFLTAITDMGGYTSTLEYSEVPILNQSGSVIESQIIAVTSPTGTSEVDYFATNSIGPGQLAFIWTWTNPNGVSSITEFAYEGANNGITKIYDNNGGFKEFHVDLQKREVTHVIMQDPLATEYFGYDEDGNKNSITKGGYETQYVFDSLGNIIQVTDPRDKVSYLVFDSNDNLESITDPMNRTTTFVFDGNDNLSEFTSPLNTNSFEYYPDGNLKSYTDPNGNVTDYEYDSFGYLTKVEYPVGNPTFYTNDDVGRIITQTDVGVTLNYEYDDFNQLTLATFPDGTTIDMAYDFMYLSEFVDRSGRKTNMEYDGMNQIVRMQTPQDEIQFMRDQKGNILDLIINGVGTTYAYDEMDRIRQMTNPDGTSRHYTYDPLGNKITRVDENGTLTTYTYDYMLLSQIDYSDDTPDVEYTFNDNGEMVSMTDVSGTTTYTYSDGGRLINIDRPGTDGDLTYTYDDAGSRLSMSIPEMSVSYVYDELRRLTNVESDFASAAYQYNIDGNLIKKTYGNGSYTDYHYDELNRLHALQNKKSTDEIFSGFDYTYDNSSMIETILDNDGNLFSYNYDNAYRLTEEKAEDANGHILWDDKFTYDYMGNRFTEENNGIVAYYENNINNQLISLKKQSNDVSGLVFGDTAVKVFVNNIQASLSYFGDTIVEFTARDIPLQFLSDTGYFVAYAGGVLAEVDDSSRFVVHTKKYPNNEIYLTVTDDTSGVSVENINLITRSYETIHYHYDPNGNLVSRISPYDTINYMYDAENRLLKVDFPGSDIEEYEYDGFSQRITVTGVDTDSYVYDNLFQAIKISTIDDSRFITRGLSFGGGIGGIISENETTNTYFYNNHRGDIINFKGDSDTSLNISYIIYKAFGERYDRSEMNYFNSKEMDYSTHFINYGYRYYMPETGKWNSRDPLGYSGGTNYYSFAGNNPVNWLDLWGLFRFGKRPLGGGPWLGPASSNPLDDYFNTELSHEHGFFEDGSGDNKGFGPDGRFSEDNPEDLGYRYDDEHYDDDIMREAMERVEDGEYSVLGNPWDDKNNCQDWADRLREEYEKVKKEREENGNGCK